MTDEGPSSSSSHAEKEEEVEQRGPPSMFITHKVSKMDTLAGLAIKYGVNVADIKRANSLLSDSAMFAKDTVLIPTQKMTCGVQYSTWAGMIVAQYGRIPGDSHLVAGALSFANDSPPRHSAAVDYLQRYYGTGDSSSEPPDFRPGEAESSVSGTEIELSDLDHLRRLSDKSGATESSRAIPGSVEYAGSRSGSLADDRVRRRRTNEAFSESLPVSEQEEQGHILLNAPDPVAGSSPDRGFIQQSRSNSRNEIGRRNTLTHETPRRRESLFERLKRVASQPALAGGPPIGPRLAEAFATPSSESLPPLPPGRRTERASSGKVTEKEVKKVD